MYICNLLFIQAFQTSILTSTYYGMSLIGGGGRTRCHSIGSRVRKLNEKVSFPIPSTPSAPQASPSSPPAPQPASRPRRRNPPRRCQTPTTLPIRRNRQRTHRLPPFLAPAPPPPQVPQPGRFDDRDPFTKQIRAAQPQHLFRTCSCRLRYDFDIFAGAGKLDGEWCGDGGSYSV